jgi:hypothetical protein
VLAEVPDVTFRPSAQSFAAALSARPRGDPHDMGRVAEIYLAGSVDLALSSGSEWTVTWWVGLPWLPDFSGHRSIERANGTAVGGRFREFSMPR